ncbi:hypothetical protein CLE01_11150 [Cryobacterium levicorallinum]|nr:hypothetical protein CLE01_11150 [Cryobacterium levicorallinum]
MFFDGPFLGQLVEVTAHGSGRKSQARGQIGCGQWAILREHLPHAVPGAFLQTIRSRVRPFCARASAAVSY